MSLLPLLFANLALAAGPELAKSDSAAKSNFQKLWGIDSAKASREEAHRAPADTSPSFAVGIRITETWSQARFRLLDPSLGTPAMVLGLGYHRTESDAPYSYTHIQDDWFQLRLQAQGEIQGFGPVSFYCEGGPFATIVSEERTEIDLIVGGSTAGVVAAPQTDPAGNVYGLLLGGGARVRFGAGIETDFGIEGGTGLQFVDRSNGTYRRSFVLVDPSMVFGISWGF